MRKWLLNDAISRVWARPNLDNQMVCRLSPIGGKKRHRIVIPIEGRFLPLPTDTDLYQVYDLGNFHPKGELSIDYLAGWVQLDTLVNRTGASFFFYDIFGIIFPSVDVFIKRTLSDRFIVAVKYNSSISEESEIYCKLYNPNALDVIDKTYQGVRVKTYRPNDGYENVAIIKVYEDMLSNGDSVILHINGRRYMDAYSSDMPPGCIVEIISDDTVVRTVSFKLTDLPSFLSELDNCKKYLLHLPKPSGLQFRDDVEIFVREGNIGHYYHRHYRYSLTQLTHCDYAISCNEVQGYAETAGEWGDVYIDLIVRDSGLSKELVFNDNRIHELYRLNDDQIINAMTGLNSHLSFWKASNLEMSDINYLRSNQYKDITHKLVSDAYGYNAASFYSANTPSLVGVDSSGLKIADLAPLYTEDSSIYEYGEDGTLLGCWYHLGGEYVCRHNSAHYAEAFSGRASNTLDIRLGADDVLISRHQSFRFYLEGLDENGLPDKTFTDVTEDESIVKVDGGMIVRWVYDHTRFRSVLVSDKNHLVTTHQIPDTGGVIRAASTINIEGVEILNPFTMATVNVFLNNHPLVHGIDYLLDWPAITIVNKSFIVAGGMQEVTIRSSSPAAALSVPKVGFVINGVLSDNTEYDIKDDKVVRIVVGGGIKTRDDVTFREDTTIIAGSDYDGLPYSIDATAIPVNTLLEGGYSERREKALERDTIVEDYLTIHLPEPLLSDKQPLLSRYPIYSPVMNKIITDYNAGNLIIKSHDPIYRITTEELDEIMSRYDYLLTTDPAFTGVNDWFISVEPHWFTGTIEIEPLLYTLLDRINSRYFNGRVSLAHHLTIKES